MSVYPSITTAVNSISQFFTSLTTLQAQDPEVASTLVENSAETTSQTFLEEQRDQDAREMGLYQRAISQCVASILLQYNAMHSMLDIGSGNKPIIEYLPTVSQALKDRVHLSDWNQGAVQRMQAKYPHNTAFTCDMTNLSGIQQGTYHSVVIHDVFNFLYRDFVKTTCQQVHRVLQAGGYFIQFCTRGLVPMSILDEFTADHLVYFPSIDSKFTWTGITVTDRTEFTQGLNADRAIEDVDKGIFLTYVALSPRQRYAFCGLASNSHMACVFERSARCIKKWNLPSTRTIIFEPHFEAKIQESLVDVGFTVHKCEHILTSYIGPRNEASQGGKMLNKNMFCKDRADCGEATAYVIPEGQVQEEVNMLVIVAQKI